MEYYSVIKRKAFESVLMRWMNLEPIIQSEVSQKEKDKYCILMHIYGIWKNCSEEFISRAAAAAAKSLQSCPALRPHRHTG